MASMMASVRGTLTVTVTLLDTESEDAYEVGQFDLLPDQVTAQLVVPVHRGDGQGGRGRARHGGDLP